MRKIMGCRESNKVRVHPRNQQKQFVRKNGWTRPIHYLQVVAWVVIFIISLVYFGTVAIAVVTTWKPAAYVCVGIVLLIHLIVLLVATTINPADDNARQQIKQNHQMPEFDRSVHPHVIENEYCHLCETYVTKTSKHCRACNKCVKDFDHHCLWLNNCVGVRNYRYFLASITTAFIGALIITAVSLFVFINSLLDFQYLDPNVWWKAVSPVLFQVFIGIMILLCIICCFLLGQLLFFHFLLIHRGITTYDYIQNSRSKKETRKTGKFSSSANRGGEQGTQDDLACATPTDVVDTTLKNKKQGVVVKVANGIADNSMRLDSGNTTSYEAISDVQTRVMVPSAFVTDTSVKNNARATDNQSVIRSSPSEFTNAAFAPEENKNSNTNSNSLQRPSNASVHSGSIHSRSSLGELGTWEAPQFSTGQPTVKPTTTRESFTPERSASGLSDSLEPDEENDKISETSVVVNGKQESRPNKHQHHKRKRHSKKSMMRHREDGAPRPLPVLPENSNPALMVNGSPRYSNSPSRLPPLRKSIDLTSSMEDLHYSLGPGRKLPPLSASSSMNSLTSYASESITSSRISSHLNV